jgi:hypothetical protein
MIETIVKTQDTIVKSQDSILKTQDEQHQAIQNVLRIFSSQTNTSDSFHIFLSHQSSTDNLFIRNTGFSLPTGFSDHP